MITNRTEPELLAACRSGSREALESLFLAHQKRVYSIALNFLGGDRETAADVTQQVFLRIFRKIEEFRGESELTTWIYRLTVNCCIDEQRRRRRFFSLEGLFGEFRPGKPAVERLERLEETGEVQRAVASLPVRFRIPIVLKYVEDLSYKEIAEVLGCSVGTVSSRINRGHRLLARKLRHLKP